MGESKYGTAFIETLALGTHEKGFYRANKSLNEDLAWL